MKLKNITLIVIFGVVILLLLLRIRPSDNQTTRPSEQVEGGQPGTTPAQRPPTTVPSTAPTPKSNFTALHEMRLEQRAAAVEKGRDEWRTPIAFYGKVVDQNANPIADANVEFGCNDLSPEGTSNYHTNSDASGYFSIGNITGKLLSVNVTKTGYYKSKQDNAFFTYAGANTNFIPDPSNPVIFHLRKKSAGEALIHFHKSFSVPKDGTPIQIDLASGKQVSSGRDILEVACWTQDSGKKSGEQFDWKCQYSVPGGGLQIYNEEFPYLAPERDYVPTGEIDMTVKPGMAWAQDVRCSFFVQTADGKYARIDFRMIAHGDHFCTIDSFFNPSGSRNLEPTN